MKNYLLRKVVILAILSMFILPLSPAQPFATRNTILTTQPTSLQYTVTFSRDDVLFSSVKGYDVVQLKNGSCINELGKPMIPTQQICIALPEDITVQNVQIIAVTTEELAGRYNIFPGQPAIRIDSFGKYQVFIEPDQATYSSTTPYPGSTIVFSYQTDLAGQNIAVLEAYPIQYIPSEKRLTMITSMTIVIHGTTGYICGDYLSLRITESGRQSYESMVKDMVMNPQDVQLHTAPNQGYASLALPPGGPYAHVIITSDADSAYWSPLVDWHTKRGLKDTVVTTEYIYSHYAGTTNQLKIRAFVSDANINWGTLYVLIGGENSTVPFARRTYDTSRPEDANTPSDMYYADYDDDWTCECHVGRVTADDYNEIPNFINKVLWYEQTPSTTDYPLKVLLIGMDVDASTHGQYLKETISGYIPARFTKTKVYDSDGGNHRTAVLNALNDGQHLVNHAGHGDYNWMDTGYINHDGLGIYSSDIDALTNTGKLSIVTSMACLVNGMDSNTPDTISEHFVVYNPDKAGIAYTGNTRLGWGYVGQPATLSGQLDRDWWRGLFQNDKYIIGETLSYAKSLFSTGAPDVGLKQHCKWEFSLLGEPAMPIWTDTPRTLTVSHPLSAPTTPSAFPVYVSDAGTPVNQAYVCLWKGTEIYQTGYTDTSGDVTFNIDPATGGTIYVTVTKHNYLPYQGQAQVQYHNPPNIPNNPYPMNNAVDIALTADLAWDGGDVDEAQQVTYNVYFGTSSSPPYLDTIGPYPSSQTRITYDPGNLNVYTQYFWKIESKDNDPETPNWVSGPIWNFRTLDNILPEWRNQGENKSEVPPGDSVSLSAQGRDNIALDWAYLSTNESGDWLIYSGGDWWNHNWAFSKQITINHTKVADDLTNFPVLISISSDADLAAHAQPDGDDLVFVDKTNTTQFAHEIESYNSVTGQLVAWVNVPFVSSSQDTILYMYYGNPSCNNQENVVGTWDVNYLTVHHMVGATWSELDDSTMNHWDVSSAGGNPSYNQPGEIGKCVDFDPAGGWDYLKVGSFRLPTDSTYTGSAWVYVDGSASTVRYIFEGDAADGISLCVEANEEFLAVADTTIDDPAYCYSTTSVDVSNPQWIYVCTRADATTNQLDLFVNGINEGNDFINGQIKAEPTGLNIGTYMHNNNYYMNGKIDELRVSNVPRADAWILTEYRMMSSPTTFISLSQEVSGSGGVKYGSPLYLGDVGNQWMWSNFTWQNPAIPEGTMVGWRLYYLDSSKNQNATDIMTFKVGTGSQFLCGDVTYDHSVNVNDVVYLINYLFVAGSPEPVPMRCVGDVNGDGVVNVNDVVYLINYLFVAGSPAPGGCC
jgi:hypothetical protein